VTKCTASLSLEMDDPDLEAVVRLFCASFLIHG